MFTIYNIAIQISSFFLRLIALFHPKIKLFTEGRKTVFSYLNSHILPDDHILWIHTASLGEFEQGLPIIERLKKKYPSHKILVTFFSPSGYEVKKNTTAADLVTYLPMDTKANVAKFLKIVRPELAIFVKYEIWPNYLNALKQSQVPTLLISAIFKKKQIFFKPYGGFMREALRNFSFIFVQDQQSITALKNIQLTNTAIGGDTRFDRVGEILQRDNSLAFMEAFKNNGSTFVAGSTWPEDEEAIVPYINSSNASIKYVLAPHNIKEDHIHNLAASIQRKTILYSQIGTQDLSEFEVLIVDTIGILTKIYSYADIGYVGGGYATGLHNTLEPAAFGIPVIIGPHYQGFKEAEELVALKGVLTTNNKADFAKILDSFIKDADYLKTTGSINSSYVNRNMGASTQIMNYIGTIMEQ
ncbi:3-deoxy-D-manno-octulosonic acid transferase [Arenibacter sp. 6A1]|uniref:3-deoxy-D-manno-octulosonic acid transferase n=1 Tax=Arenibacter sp. 6A1 TaxID=2720391 RepID=UPI001444FBDB|nr:glycosyltransferase N-terminal domain-containing protein [Arenibacter sp. 6A1]NKI25516.1 3-deoxy-D-manno-octulosonic acid transferase [Arenibacter sp. 6A1]